MTWVDFRKQDPDRMISAEDGVLLEIGNSGI